MMDNLFVKVTKVLQPGTRIEIHSSLTQHFVGASGVVLWNEEPLILSDTTYNNFKDIIRQKSCKFYNLNRVLPFHDFCIALLCCVEYSLNHKLTPDISARTYASAWRTMVVIADTGSEDVKLWIRKYMYGRSSLGYTNALGEVLQSSTAPMKRRLSTEMSSKVLTDDDIISRACTTRNVVEISNNDSTVVSKVLQRSTSTPESQLDSLTVIHDMMIHKLL